MERNNSATLAISLICLIILAIIAVSLPIIQPTPNDSLESSEQEHLNSSGGLQTDGEGGPDLSFLTETAFLLLIISVGVFTIVLGYWALNWVTNQTATTAPRSPPNETESPRTDLENLATVAGNAAQRIQQSDSFENEIYRAWREMTRTLAVSNPQTKTAGEFADAAIRAGMNEQDVHELTQLFDSVRYNDREPTTEDEQRAIEILTRINETCQSDRS